MDEATAIRCLKAGDFGGLEYLTGRYQVKAIRAAFLVTGDRATAEDVVSEVFLRMFQRPGNIDPNRPFEPYLIKSVINSALNACRAEKKALSLDNDIQSVEELISQAASVESQVEYSELKAAISEALWHLPARQRAAIVQRYYLDMSEKDMASTLDAPVGTVKWLLNSARSALRELLGKERI